MSGRDADENELWARANRAAVQTQQALAAAGNDPRAWVEAASNGAGALGGLARRLEPGGRGPLTDAAMSLARAAQAARRGSSGHGRIPRSARPYAPVQVAGVTVLAGRGGPVGAATTFLQMLATIRSLGASRRARTRKQSH